MRNGPIRRALDGYLAMLIDTQRRGGGVAFAVPRLLDLARPGLTLHDVTTNSGVPGGKAVADALNRKYGVALSEATVVGQLETRGLPVPP